jgi:hypothetical protein
VLELLERARADRAEPNGISAKGEK